MVYKHDYDIGVAVSTERGLMVPVLRDADRLSLRRDREGDRRPRATARDGKIAIDDLQGGTFTITNGGVFGSLLSTPILNPPQSGILGMHAIQKRPVVVDDQIDHPPDDVPGPDLRPPPHRRPRGGQFLVRVKELLEDPERLMLDAQCSTSSAEIFPPSAVRGILVMIRMLQVREAEIDLMRSLEQRFAGLRARMVEFEQRLANWRRHSSALAVAPDARVWDAQICEDMPAVLAHRRAIESLPNLPASSRFQRSC